MKKERACILVVLIAGIGDLVLASKSLRALRNGFPEANIHLLTSSAAFPIAKNYTYIDKVWAFPIRELRKSRYKILQVLRLIKQLRKYRFSTIINLYRVTSVWGALKMGLLFLLLKGKKKVGHGYKGFGLFLSDKADEHIFQGRHFADAMEEIAQLAGGIPDSNGIEVFWGKGAEEKCRQLFSNTGRSEKIILGVNPGGDRMSRRWNPDYYATVANRLKKRFHAKIVLLGGPSEDKIAPQIQGKIDGEVLNLAGQLTLNELVYVISQCDLLLTNDSGPMHIAAALKIPLVAIFGPESPVLFGPHTSEDLYRIVFKEVDCRPCTKRKCSEPKCLDLVTPQEVFEKCVEIIESRGLGMRRKNRKPSK
ncbi:MAG: lipopolysaccharide heptosyltransferase II [Deltaproteobacteria bacterium]|nr:lipopolysaccharide heptosyltransferase II [Deltaproteobacteria bacterium]MBW1978068.1 lipopolysaccharide heptosyltransferase II [Deltaproteobacteria bacterium]MBW2044886.1 lipopolysaccharide heptosyltransferase II [Deltaproteobacteria bacterium]MBW2301256.1 lipopolysaccharide heptosyltransferase II [Deltaproteobacteria bacterium]